eukprot:1589558-Rhodomonas_salina.2
MPFPKQETSRPLNECVAAETEIDADGLALGLWQGPGVDEGVVACDPEQARALAKLAAPMLMRACHRILQE